MQGSVVVIGSGECKSCESSAYLGLQPVGDQHKILAFLETFVTQWLEAMCL